jgi:hypothetical protein
MIKFISDIVSISGTSSTFYISLENDSIDFTNSETRQILRICSSEGECSIPIEIKELPLLIEVLKGTVLSKQSKVVAWNWKDFVSYVSFHFGKLVEFQAVVLDLKIIESYFFIKQEKPVNYLSALIRFKKLKTDKDWEKFYNIYNSVYLPLITLVIPTMENTPLLDCELKDRVYAHYSINGQDNGRMLCSNARIKGYNPHTLSKDQKGKYKPCVPYNVFLNFDFRSMEVAVLAYLANDEKLLELIQAPDIYSSIFVAITNSVADDNSKILAKKIFLPTIYGMSARTLAEQADIQLSLAEQICSNINKIFFKSVNYVKGFVSLAESQGTISDYFGKRRTFTENFYKARNFCIQSPASLICLEKLVQLWKKIQHKTRICYHVHDGYYVYAQDDNWKEVAIEAKKVLVSESQICPGMRLRVACHGGTKLNNLKSLEKR